MKAGAISAIFSNLQVGQLCLPLLRLLKDATVFGEIMSDKPGEVPGDKTYSAILLGG